MRSMGKEGQSVPSLSLPISLCKRLQIPLVIVQYSRGMGWEVLHCVINSSCPASVIPACEREKLPRGILLVSSRMPFLNKSKILDRVGGDGVHSWQSEGKYQSVDGEQAKTKGSEEENLSRMEGDSHEHEPT